MYYRIERFYEVDGIIYKDTVYTIASMLTKEKIETYFPPPNFLVTPISSLGIIEAIRDARSRGWLK